MSHSYINLVAARDLVNEQRRLVNDAAMRGRSIHISQVMALVTDDSDYRYIMGLCKDMGVEVKGVQHERGYDSPMSIPNWRPIRSERGQGAVIFLIFLAILAIAAFALADMGPELIKIIAEKLNLVNEGQTMIANWVCM